MGDRRPLKSRQSGLAQAAARRLAASRVTPNQISIASVVAAGIVAVALWISAENTGAVRAAALLVAALGCQLRLLCNLLDGMVAVEGGKAAPDGAFWNEAPDRVADILIFAGAGTAAGWPALGWAAASMAVLTAYLREMGAGLGMPADFSGPMAKPHRMALLTGAAVLAVVWPPALLWALWIAVLGAAVTAARRAVRLLRWLNSRQRDQVVK